MRGRTVAGLAVAAAFAVSTPGRATVTALTHTAPRLGACATCHGSGDGARAVAAARRYLGKPYVWGGTGPGTFDCSGLTQRAYRDIGIDIPRNSRQQAATGRAVHGIGNARPGDLLFWAHLDGTIHHVAMYVGNGRLIEAPQPGEAVSERPVYSGVIAIRRIT